MGLTVSNTSLNCKLTYHTLWQDPVNGLCIVKHILGESLQLIEECIDAFTTGLAE